MGYASRLEFKVGRISLVCQMYVSSTTTNNDNEFRYNLFCAKCMESGDMESHQTIKPPFGGSACRVNQLCVVPDPGHGWTTDSNGSVTIEWMQGSPALEAVL